VNIRLHHLFLLVLLYPSHPGMGQNFENFLSSITAAPAARRQFMADSFMTLLPSTPLVVNDSICYFLYTGDADDVHVAGDHNNWMETYSPLTRIPDTDFWYLQERFLPDARIDYRLVADKSWMLDPRNPFSIAGAGGPNSELRMPYYVEARELITRPHIPHGTLVDTVFRSAVAPGIRQLRIYLPAGYDAGNNRYPFVLFHDGPDYIRLALLPTILDNLIADGRIPPLIAAFVPAIDRAREYTGDLMEKYTWFIARELMPFLSQRYRVHSDARYRAAMGSSSGGNIALHIAMTHPDIFGNVGAQSSYIQTSISDRFEQTPFLPLRVYLDLGRYDIPMLIPMVHAFVQRLEHAEYDYMFRESSEGHSWGNWRARIGQALTYFFSSLLDTREAPVATVRDTHSLQPYPNPASHRIFLDVAGIDRGLLSVVLHDALGRPVRILHEGNADMSRGTLSATVGDLPRGMYFLRITTDRQSVARMLHLY
jgi:enterochelin esterase-like enzyme